jgi:hypothetical protein
MEVSTTGVNFTNNLTQGGVAVPTASQVAAKQDTLVSGTNIKTINGTSLLGPGNIPVVTSPSGVSGAIQFSDGSAFASDAANFFWNNTTKRLGVGTNTPGYTIEAVGEIRGITQVSGQILALRRTSDGAVQSTIGFSAGLEINDTSGQGGRLSSVGATALKWLTSSSQPRIGVGFNGSILATAHIQGSGSTSATTSLLVQNSSGTASFQIKDDGNSYLGQFNTASGNNALDQFTAKLFTLTNAFVSHSVGSTYNGSTGDSSLALCGLGVGGGFFGGIRMFTSSSSATPVLAMIVDRNQSVGIGLTNSTDLTVNASAKLQVDSTTKGFLPPRMTTTQKNAIASPAAGLVVYDSTTNKLQCYNGSTWNDLF